MDTTDRLLTPRIPLLLRLAEVLKVDDLAQLTGEQKLTSAAFTKPAHEALPQVAEALATYPILTSGITPVAASALTERVTQLWGLWHGIKRQKTAIAGFLPDLLRDAQAAIRLLDGADRRTAWRALAQTYHLTQLFLSWQGGRGCQSSVGRPPIGHFSLPRKRMTPAQWRAPLGI